MGFGRTGKRSFNDPLIEYNNLLKQHEKLERELTELKAKKAESRAFFAKQREQEKEE
ncbi:hypothetical protein [Helicobacter suis]|uniref:hypothetical protein n=1 Tax=Helicobacter suis TaxID=104628 RepID=UPI0013D56616|nr:hypothetical protein [Helicobacter suis]